MKVLHVTGGLDVGGTESWVCQFLEQNVLLRPRIDYSVLVFSSRDYRLRPRVLATGARVVVCPLSRNPVVFLVRLIRAIRESGCDAVHSHVHYMSALVCLAAALCGVEQRIAHAHTGSTECGIKFLGGIYRRIAMFIIRITATHALAVSEQAAKALYGNNWRKNRKVEVAYCGINLLRFAHKGADGGLRESLGVPQGTIVIGHVGRLVPVKNHQFLMEICGEMKRRGVDCRFFCVGDGPLRDEIQRQVGRLGIDQEFKLLGGRGDVPELMMSVFDVLCMPSLYEGLPVTLIEAQAASLPAVVSDTITKEVVEAEGLISTLSLAAPVGQWAAALESAAMSGHCRPMEAAGLKGSRFDIEVSAERIRSVYLSGHARI